MQYADYVVTEAGFGADLGAEKFLDFKCRNMGVQPSVVVIVATIRALKLHGGVDKLNLASENVNAVKLGFGNLKKHIENMQQVYNVPVVVTLNKFTTDTEQEISAVRQLVETTNTPFAINDVWALGGDGASELAQLVTKACDNKYQLHYAYDCNDSIKSKVEAIATKIYGADGVKYESTALQDIDMIEKLGFGKLPIIIAKTQYSLSDNKDLMGEPKEFDITVRSVELRSGAGFIVVCLGKMLLMPGLNKTPAYEKMTIDNLGNINGMY